MKKASKNPFGFLIAIIIVAAVFLWIFRGNGEETFNNLANSIFGSSPSSSPTPSTVPGATPITGGGGGATVPGSTYGTLMISAPNNNDIYVDGEYKGNGVAIMTQVIPGTYSIYFRDHATDQLTWQGTAVVDAGKTSQVKISR